MRERRSAALMWVLAGLLAAGCSTGPGGSGAGGFTAGSGAGDGRSGAEGASSPGFGTRFLDVDECSSFGTTSSTEVPCTGERAAARVVARYDGAAADGPPCPATTDFVLHIGAQKLSAGGGVVVPRGYACMRALEPPHPGDPGRGGGPRTIVGDCVYGSGGGQVRETACDGSGTRKPQYEVVTAVDARDGCPASTVLYVQLGGEKPVGCARPVRPPRT
ncbi:MULTISPECIES: hypothetical protein [unclassified Streptomyces]|uniref:hypothetical protein n=1 Tax=unclassified Streptomyces TaxID=2593676 RepID=UPI001F0405AC|nr:MULTISPECIES: hypothetical protein [unclassified Streptomyces]MCH0563697.1 hypothetical protein [Streptomyces sp. MUM 2J]MCH0571085.1 hypothetical protein [Streptomyces sp. MUM 136J]